MTTATEFKNKFDATKFDRALASLSEVAEELKALPRDNWPADLAYDAIQESVEKLRYDIFDVFSHRHLPKPANHKFSMRTETYETYEDAGDI